MESRAYPICIPHLPPFAGSQHEPSISPDADRRILRRPNPILRRNPNTINHLLLWSISMISASAAPSPGLPDSQTPGLLDSLFRYPEGQVSVLLPPPARRWHRLIRHLF